MKKRKAEREKSKLKIRLGVVTESTQNAVSFVPLEHLLRKAFLFLLLSDEHSHHIAPN